MRAGLGATLAIGVWSWIATCSAVEVPFAVPELIGGVSGLAAAVSADLDGDGDPDLVYASPGFSRIAWSRNDRGSYALPQTLISSEGVRRLVTADFDLDGRADLVSAGTTSAAWHRNTGVDASGVPQFETRPVIASNLSGVTTLAVGDFNRNGKPDLLVGRDEAPTLQLFLHVGGSGSGFGTASTVPTPAGVGRIEGLGVADVDQDGRVDAVATSSAAPGVTIAQLFWVPRTSTSAFGTAVIVDREQPTEATALAYGALAVLDYDDENGPDIAYLRTDVTGVLESGMVLRLNQGNGFAPGDTGREDFETDAMAPGAIAVADVDRDGNTDLWFDDSADGHGVVIENRGLDADFHSLPGTGLPRQLAGFVHDDDLDGDPDLLMAGSDGVVRRQRNRRPHGRAFLHDLVLSAALQTAPYGVLDGPIEIVAGQLGRGKKRQLLFTEFSAGRVASATMRRSFAGPMQSLLPRIGDVPVLTGVGAAQALALRDTDHDGDEDFVLTTGVLGSPTPGNQNRLVIGRNDGDVYAGTVTACNQGIDLGGVAIGDVDSNGLFEVVFTAAGNNRVAIPLGPCASEFLLSTPQNGVPNAPVGIAIADLDQDGDRDVLIAARGDDAPPLIGDLVGWYPNSGSGGFGALQRIGIVEGARDVVAVDFDRDGRIDVATASQGIVSTDPAAGRVLLYRNLGGGAFALPLVAASGIHAPGRPAFSDIDHDGDLDLFVSSESDATRLTLRNHCGLGLYEALGNGSYAQQPYCLDRNALRGPFSRIALADLDGDGVDDVAATGSADDRLAFFASLALKPFQSDESSGTNTVTLSSGEEACPRHVDVEHVGRTGDDAIGLKELRWASQGADSAKIVAAMVLRRDDGDGVAEPLEDVEVARDETQSFAFNNWSFTPAATLASARLEVGQHARFWLCVVANRPAPFTAQGLRLNDVFVTYRDVDSGLSIGGSSLADGTADFTTVRSARIFGDGLEDVD